MVALAALLAPPAFAQEAPAAGTGIVDQAIELGSRLFSASGSDDGKSGLYPEMSNMVTGAGWIAAGPGYRQWLWGDRAVVDASAAVSWRAYKMAQVRFEVVRLARSRVAIGTQARWQDLTQITYFGEGPDTSEGTRGQYRLRSGNVVTYATFRPTQWFSIKGHAGWLTSPSIDAPTGTFKRDYPDVRELFPLDPVYQRQEQPGFVYGGVGAVADTRDHRGYPSEGTLFQAGWSKYVDRDTDAFTFDRYEIEGAQFVPLAGRRVVLAVHGWLVGTDTSFSHTVPFYMLPSLGGASTLRSFPDYRFHDRNLVLAQVESRVPLGGYVDAALFIDAGNVAAKFTDLDLSQRSYGAGVRLHTAKATFARLDVARGREGWRVVLRLNDPFRLGRLSRRTAVIPFVP